MRTRFFFYITLQEAAQGHKRSDKKSPLAAPINMQRSDRKEIMLNFCDLSKWLMREAEEFESRVSVKVY